MQFRLVPFTDDRVRITFVFLVLPLPLRRFKRGYTYQHVFTRTLFFFLFSHLYAARSYRIVIAVAAVYSSF